MATALLLRRSLRSLNNTVKSSIQRHHSVMAGKLGKTFPQRFLEKEVHSEMTKHAEMAIWNIKYKSESVRRTEDEALNSKTASSGKREPERSRNSEMKNNDGYGSASDVHGASHGDFNPSDGASNHIDIGGSDSTDGGSSCGGASCGGGCGGGG